LRELLTPESIANTLRMSRSQFAGVFLLVEGDTDSRFYRLLVDKSAHVKAANNRDNALKVLDILKRGAVLGVAAIVDADFSRVESERPKKRQHRQIPTKARRTKQSPKLQRRRWLSVKNLFVTDGHDLEMMLLRSPALEKLLGEFASEKLVAFETNQKTKLRERLLEGAAPIGYLLWYSLQEALGLRFEDLSFGKFIDEKTLLVNEKELVTAIKNHSGRHDLKSDELQAKLKALRKAAHDLWQVCCGHHVLEILSFALRKTIGTYNKGEATREALERSLRLAFERVHFKETRLYRKLLRWQSTHPPFVLISP
jgi:hypothetical protein